MDREPQLAESPVQHAEFSRDGLLVFGSPGFLSDGLETIPAYLARFDLIDGRTVTPEVIADAATRWQEPGTDIDGRLPGGAFRLLVSHRTADGGIALLSIANSSQRGRDQLARQVLYRHPTPLWVNDVETGDILFFNARTRDLFEGDDMPDNQGNVADMMTDRGQVARLLDNLRRHGHVDRYVISAQSMKGRPFWLYGSSSLFQHQGRDVVVTVVQDVTTLQQQEEEAKRTRALLNDALGGLNEGCALFDADGCLVACNALYREINAGMDDVIKPGVTWAEMLRTMVGRRLVPLSPEGDVVWVDRILARTRKQGTVDIDRADGRVTRLSARPTSLGGFIVSETDISATRRAERSARAFEQLLSTVLGASPAVLCMSRIGSGEILYQSPSCTDLFGYSANARDQFADPVDRMDFTAELLNRGRVDEYRAEARRTDGTAFPALFAARVIDYRGEDVMVSTVTDLSDQLAAERRIDEAAERLRDAVEAMSEGFILYDADERVVMANQRFHEMNAPYAHLITPGVHTRTLLEASVESGHVVDAEGWLRDYEEELTRNASGSHRAFEFQLSDGTWVNSLRRPTRDGGYVITWLDVTEQKTAAMELARVHARLSDAIDSIDEGFALFDAEDRLVMWNQTYADLNYRIRDKLKVGTGYREILNAGLASNALKAGSAASIQDQIDHADLREPLREEFEHHDGTWYSIARSPTSEGGFVITRLDITKQKAATAALAHLNDRMRDAIESIDEGFALYDNDSRLVLWNSKFAALNSHIADKIVIGARHADLLEAAIASGNHSRETAEAMRASKDADNFRERGQVDFQHVDGRWYSLSRNPTREGGFVTTRLDITERKLAAAELTRLNDRLQDAIESLDGGFALYGADGALIAFNQRYAELNAPIADVIRVGVTYAEILERAIDVYDIPEHRIETVRSSGQPSTHAERFQFEFEDRDGRWFLVTRHPTSEGGFVITRVDTTEQKKAEAAERESHELPRRVLDACPVALVMSDFRTGHSLYRNAEDRALLGETRSEQEFWVDPAERVKFLEQIGSKGRVDEMQVTMTGADGTPFPALMSARTIEYRGDPFVVAYTFDLSDRVAMEGELSRQRDMLHQSEKLSALGELLAGVAHELNNPLSVVVGHALMLEEEIDDPAVLKRIGKISAAAERCSRIVKTFLAMARQRPARLERTSVNQVIETALEVAGFGLRSGGAQIVTDLPADLPPVLADGDQLAQVFANLIVNAEQALSARGAEARLSIATRLSRTGKEVVIEVMDNGPGIPEPIRARVFEPFFTTKTVGEGTGIGLAFCHRIIDTHNGHISVAEAPGGGAHFTIRLGVAEAEPQADPAAARARTTRGHVLVIDDEPDVAELIERILLRDDYRVTVVHSAQAAFDGLARGGFDAILSDVTMPGPGGREILAEIRKRWPAMEQRLGFITGDTMSPGAESFLGSSGRPCLEKPVSPGDVRELAAALMDAGPWGEEMRR